MGVPTAQNIADDSRGGIEVAIATDGQHTEVSDQRQEWKAGKIEQPAAWNKAHRPRKQNGCAEELRMSVGALPTYSSNLNNRSLTYWNKDTAKARGIAKGKEMSIPHHARESCWKHGTEATELHIASCLVSGINSHRRGCHTMATDGTKTDFV